jgi:hypothetical protein
MGLGEKKKNVKGSNPDDRLSNQSPEKIKNIKAIQITSGELSI